MAAATALLVTIVHIEATGHVLAAVSSGGVEPTLEELTGAGYLRVRIPGTAGFVNVPTTVLKATRAPVGTGDVLDRPQHYVIDSESSQLTPGLAPENSDPDTGTPGAKVVIVWQVGQKSVEFDGVVATDGKLPGPQPGATSRLLAIATEPLRIAEV